MWYLHHPLKAVSTLNTTVLKQSIVLLSSKLSILHNKSQWHLLGGFLSLSSSPWLIFSAYWLKICSFGLSVLNAQLLHIFILRSATLFATLSLIFEVQPNHKTLENLNTHFCVHFPCSTWCYLFLAAPPAYLFQKLCKNRKTKSGWRGNGIWAPQQSKSRRKTCHHSALEINETEGKAKAKCGESTAAKKGSMWREQEGRKYPFQDSFF